MTLQSEYMGKLVADIDTEMEGRERGYADIRGELLFRCRDALSAFRPAHREAQPETDGGGEAATCQACGGEIQGWTCQGCGATFRENDAGVLVRATPEGQTEGAVTNLDRVREFHETFGVPVLASPCIPADRVKLRLDILDEERCELSDALEAGDVVEVADALTDMAYLIYGTALEFGIDLNACFAEVHRSNMSKLGADGKPIYREDGKVMKGPNYSPPDLRCVLAALASKGV